MESWIAVDWSVHTHDRAVLDWRLHYADIGEGPAVLLIHGLGGSWQTWLENLQALSVDHRVIAVDLPGFGASVKLPPPAKMATHVDALAALLVDLELRDVVVCGHSMGGLIALGLADRYSHLVRALVLVSAGGIKLGRARLAMIVGGFSVFNAIFGIKGVPEAFAHKPALRRLLLTPAIDDWRSLSPELALQVLPLMNAPGFGGAVRGASRAVEMTNPAEVACPTLIIWGRNDRILPVVAARELAISMPDASLVVFDGVGHCAMFERPDEFNAAFIDFLGGIRPRDSYVDPRATRRRARQLRRAERRNRRAHRRSHGRTS